MELKDGKIWRRHIDQLQGWLGYSELRWPEEEPALTTKTPIHNKQHTGTPCTQSLEKHTDTPSILPTNLSSQCIHTPEGAGVQQRVHGEQIPAESATPQGDFQAAPLVDSRTADGLTAQAAATETTQLRRSGQPTSAPPTGVTSFKPR